MTRTTSPRHLLLLALAIVALSSKVLETAYNGYLVAFALLLLAANARPALPPAKRSLSGSVLLLWVVLLPIISIQTIAHGNALRDVVRDLGALLAFYIGYTVLPRLFSSREKNWRMEVMRGMSNLGVFVVLVTLTGAVQAFLAGADAYFWRGQYVPLAHSWLPYLFVINLGLARLDPSARSLYRQRAAFCVLGTLASLSRTDFILIAFTLIVQIGTNFRAIARDPRARRFALFALTAFIVALPFMLRLSVVQERIEVGVDEEDPSLAWRFIENLAFLDEYLSADTFTQWFGFGFGGRLPLPFGIFDFDGNDSIPHLHNSYFTIIMKFGVVGLLVLVIFLYRLAVTWWRRGAHHFDGALLAGGWILLFVLGKAVTLQGLSEWSHILFFGLGSSLILKLPQARPLPNKTSASKTTGLMQSPSLPVT